MSDGKLKVSDRAVELIDAMLSVRPVTSTNLGHYADYTAVTNAMIELHEYIAELEQRKTLHTEKPE